jgi:hypothetical protein
MLSVRTGVRAEADNVSCDRNSDDGSRVRQPSRRSGVPAPMPSLAEVQRDPAILAGLTLPVIVDLRRQVGHLVADLDAAFCQAMTNAEAQHPRPVAELGRLLTPAAAAARFGVTKRWLLDHADEIPGVRRLSRKIVRFSERRLARFLDRAPV